MVKAMVSPVVMYRYESWTINMKAEHQRINAFELSCWRDSWASLGLEGDQTSPLKEISPEYSLKGLMLKLKFQYFENLMRRTDSLEKTLMLGKTEGRRRWGWQRMRCLDGITDSMDLSLSNSGKWWRTGKPGGLQSMGSQRVGHDWTTVTTSKFLQ